MRNMKYAFDLFEIELIGNGRAICYALGSQKGKEYEISLEKKSWFQKLITSEEVIKSIPCIKLKRGIQFASIAVIKLDAGCYKFTISGLAFIGLLQNRNGSYVTVSTYSN